MVKLKIKFPVTLKSRKFWLCVASALVVFANKFWAWDLDEAQVLTIVGSLLSFVLVEGLADIKGRV